MRSTPRQSARFAHQLKAENQRSKVNRRHHQHQVRLGFEFGAWLVITVVIFLTVGVMAVFALVRTGQSRQIAQVNPYNNPTTPPATATPNATAPTNPANVPTLKPAGGGGGGDTTPTTAPQVSNPTPTYSFSNVPVEKSSASAAGKAIGSQCDTNKECASKLCVPNEYGNYCGTKAVECQVGAIRCSTVGQTSVAQKCNDNGYWQTNESCSGGCSAGKCISTLCTAGQASCDSNSRKICSGDGMQWRTEVCPVSTACKQGECVADSVPPCGTGKSCSTSGSYCTTAAQQKYVCVNSEWKLLFNGQRVGVVGCEQQKAGLYLAGLHDAAQLIASSSYLLIDCSAASASISNLDAVAGETINACQLDPDSSTSFVRMNCRADAPSNTIAHSARHEAAKLWLKQRAFSGGVVPSYSELIGCRREKTKLGFQYIFHNEQPVSTIGRRDCTEAFAEAAAMYLEQPCRMKQVYLRQYGWMSSSLDSPFKGEPQCADN